MTPSGKRKLAIWIVWIAINAYFCWTIGIESALKNDPDEWGKWAFAGLLAKYLIYGWFPFILAAFIAALFVESKIKK